MKKYALIGHPLGHSMSPLIHEKLFSISGHEDSEYVLTDIAPDVLTEKIAYLKTLSGFNITIPHKQNIIPMLDELAESAKRYNAVNCVNNDGGKLVGYNTDCHGFIKSVENFPLDGKVLLLGCGGAGRMMGIEAVRQGADLTVAVRSGSVKKAEILSEEIRSSYGREIKIADIGRINGKYDVLLNSTPVGMYPEVSGCPVRDEVIENCGYFFDAVYNPTDTVLVRKAKAMGKTAVGGAAMLVYQAVKAHEIWNGTSFTVRQTAPIIKAVESAVDAMQNK